MSGSLAHSYQDPSAASGISDSTSLHQAFAMFNEMSQKLSDSYLKLENQVEQLSGELAQVSQQRLQELAEKERLADRLESLLEMLPAGVLLLDQFGRVRQSNPAAELLLSSLAQVPTLVGQRWRTLIQKCFSPRQDDGHEISLKNGRRVHLHTAPMSNEPGQLVLLTDMTETRELQSRLSQHERLSAMGKMVASLAHQIRTPLSAATLYAGHLGSDQLNDELRLRFAQKLQERLRHLESQIRDMLIFARGETPLLDQISFKQFENELAAAMEAVLLNQNAQCQITNHMPDAQLVCNRDALVGAFMNLVNNAIEASPFNQAQLEIHIEAINDQQIAVLIKDNGAGMSNELLEKTQQPFYTTKTNGTGLGLAVVQAVARAHQAEFVLTNHPNGGMLAGMVLPEYKQE